MSSRIAAADVGNDANKAIFGKLEFRTIYTKCHCKRHEDRPVIGIEELDVKKTWEGIHTRVHSPALQDNNAIYRVGNLTKKSDNPTELDLGSSKSEEDQTLVFAYT